MKTLKTKKGTELPLMNLKGKDYLQVAHRLVWFREEHPDWSLETEFVSLTDKNAVAKATVKDAAGRVMATSHKEESLADFAAGYREKAETGAIGRALALCGYGTQFEPDFDEGERVVDSPLMNPKSIARALEPDAIADGLVDPNKVPDTWTFPMGKWVARTLEQVYNQADAGPKAMANYIQWMEDNATKKGIPLNPKQIDIISHVEQFLGVMENA